MTNTKRSGELPKMGSLGVSARQADEARNSEVAVTPCADGFGFSAPLKPIN